jgi:hypothetical protein
LRLKAAIRLRSTRPKHIDCDAAMFCAGLDLAVELARREHVPKRLACDSALAIADRLRISFALFLSSEARPLMGIRDVGEWKHYAFERFRAILHLTVRNSLKTN